jgi:hypothetical protein
MVSKSKNPGKKVRKELKKLKKTLKSESKKAKALKKSIFAVKKKAEKKVKSVTAKTASLKKEMEKLKENLEKLSKKKSKKQLSEYNLFMKRQLIAGKTFKQAVRLWTSYKKGKPIIKKVKYKPKTIVRTIIKKVPVIKTKTIVKKVPVVKTRTIIKKIPVKIEEKDMEEIGSEPKTEKIEQKNEAENNEKEKLESMISKKMMEENWMNLSDEEVAIRLVTVYFQEVHRLGLKRRMELEDVINAYYETLKKIKEQKSHHATKQSMQEHELHSNTKTG